MSDLKRTSGAEATKMSQSDKVDHAVDYIFNDDEAAPEEKNANANAAITSNAMKPKARRFLVGGKCRKVKMP
jgi:hypothetical protein